MAAKGKATTFGLQIRHLVYAAAHALITNEKYLTDLDAKAGDGDLGSSMTRGALAILKLPEGNWSNPSAILSNLGETMRRSIGGSSGPFYATALLRAARSLPHSDKISGKAWANAFSSAVAAISDLGGAKVGDRTMIDALAPAAAAFQTSIDRGDNVAKALKMATKAARAGCAATAKMKPRLGRASYLGARAIGIPDAGAAAIVCWMEAIADNYHRRA